MRTMSPSHSNSALFRCGRVSSAEMENCSFWGGGIVFWTLFAKFFTFFRFYNIVIGYHFPWQCIFESWTVIPCFPFFFHPRPREEPWNYERFWGTSAWDFSAFLFSPLFFLRTFSYFYRFCFPYFFCDFTYH